MEGATQSFSVAKSYTLDAPRGGHQVDFSAELNGQQLAAVTSAPGAALVMSKSADRPVTPSPVWVGALVPAASTKSKFQWPKAAAPGVTGVASGVADRVATVAVVMVCLSMGGWSWGSLWSLLRIRDLTVRLRTHAFSMDGL